MRIENKHLREKNHVHAITHYASGSRRHVQQKSALLRALTIFRTTKIFMCNHGPCSILPHKAYHIEFISACIEEKRTRLQ